VSGGIGGSEHKITGTAHKRSMLTP